MPRVTSSVASRKRRARTLKAAKGYFGNKSRLFRYAKDAVKRAGKYAYRDRRVRRREFRSLWIARINAACRAAGLKYSVFMGALKTSISRWIENSSPSWLSTTKRLFRLSSRRFSTP